jgi:hypothetical protein
MALVEERWHAEVYFAQVKAGLNPVSPVLPDSDLLPGVRMRSSGGGMRPVWHCRNAPCAISLLQFRCLSALQPPNNIATPCP